MAYRTLLLLAILCSNGHSIGTCPNITLAELCICDETTGQPFRYRLFCNEGTTPSATIAHITQLARNDGTAGNITRLGFNGPSDTVLKAEAFAGFIALEAIEIIYSQLSYIEARVFSSLPHLIELILENNNKLTWLSVEPFIGLTSLKRLSLDRSAIEHLRENMEPFFSNITDEISLKAVPLRCNCHLQWLYDFTLAHLPLVKDAACDEGPLTSLDSTSAFNQCLNVCELGYHPCHVNATCTILSASPNTLINCSCKSGFIGNGLDSCSVLTCECPGDNMVCEGTSRQCVCEAGFSLSQTACVRTVSEEFVNLKMKCSSVDPTNVTAVDRCAERLSHAATHSLSLPDDVSATVSLLQTMIEILAEDEAHPPSLETSQNLVEVASQLLNENNQDLWRKINSTDPVGEVVNILSSMNDLGIILLTQTNITNITTDNIAMVLVRPECEDEQSVPTFSGYTISSDLLGKPPPSGSSSTLSLPVSLFSDVFANGSVANCSDVGVVSFVYEGIGPLLSLNEDQLLDTLMCSVNGTTDSGEICSWYGDPAPECPTDWQVNSVIISATVVNSSQPISSQLSSPITISLTHQDPSLSSPVCAFIDETQPLQSGDSWLTENCERDAQASSDTTTVCKCYHLTSFALVMSPTSSPPENNALHIATKIGLSLSILCLLITVLLLFGLELKNKMLHRVHRQLAIALGLAQLVFLVGVDRSSVPSPDQLCMVWAALLHYLLLATFLWQLCEGVHLYLLIGKVFGTFEKWEPIYYVISWGLPLLFVGPTLWLRFCDYGSRNYCWITPDRGANWAFHGPVIAVLLINIVVLVYVVTVIVKLSKRKEDDVCLFITLIHASLVLVPILGVTWVLGFLVVGNGVYATVVEWLFFAFTTLQGVAIFLAHCVLNREVRSAFLRALGHRGAANEQLSITQAGRRLSRATSIVSGPSHQLQRKTSQTSGALSVGGFTPSRRESEIENPYILNDLSPIREETHSSPPTPIVI